MEIVFKKIIIIDKSAQKAKMQEFKEGINFITSNASNGNYVGKSTLLKSLYHALGADADFDSSKGWELDSKYYYILIFEKDGKLFKVIRNDRYFAFYDKNNVEFFSTQNRDELSNFYSSFFNQTILLKKTGDNYQYEVAKPFSLFCLSFVDQKHYEGCQFSSFASMFEYSKVKEDIILSHLGVNDKEMNELETSNKKLNNIYIEKTKNKEILNNMIDRIAKNDELNCSSDSIEYVKKEIQSREEEYKKNLNDINKLKNELYELNTTKVLLLSYINEINENIELLKQNKQILKEHICPLCQSKINNYNEVFFKKSKSSDSLEFQLIDSKNELADIERAIELKEESYSFKEKEIRNLENIILQNNFSIENAVVSLGVRKYKEKLFSELGELDNSISNLANELKSVGKRIKELRKRVKQINDLYYNTMADFKRKYDITIFDLPENLTIQNSIKCGDNHVLTTAWINVLNKIKRELQPNGTFFPIIFDDPVDRDFDGNNDEKTFRMIFDNSSSSKQIFVSSLKKDENLIREYNIENVINVNNNQYELLNTSDYLEAIKELII